MANELVYFGLSSGLTLTAQVYNATTGATVGTAQSATEVSTSSIYRADMPGSTAAGNYVVRWLNGTTVIFQQPLYWNGTAVVPEPVAISNPNTVRDAVWANATRTLTANPGLDAAATATAVQTGLTDQGYTSARAAQLDGVRDLVESAVSDVLTVANTFTPTVDNFAFTPTAPAGAFRGMLLAHRDVSAGVTYFREISGNNGPTTISLLTPLPAAPAVGDGLYIVPRKTDIDRIYFDENAPVEGDGSALAPLRGGGFTAKRLEAINAARKLAEPILHCIDGLLVGNNSDLRNLTIEGHFKTSSAFGNLIEILGTTGIQMDTTTTIKNMNVRGSSWGNINFSNCHVHSATVAGGNYEDCEIGLLTLDASAELHNCKDSPSETATIDMSGAPGGTVVNIYGFRGAIVFSATPPATSPGTVNIWTDHGVSFGGTHAGGTYNIYTSNPTLINEAGKGTATVNIIPVAPNAMQNAAAVRTNLTTELGRIDVPISSRQPTELRALISGTVGAGSNTTTINTGLTLTANELQNDVFVIHDVSANRSYLTVVSSNTTGGALTVPTLPFTPTTSDRFYVLPAAAQAAPTAAQNAAAVRTNLATELGRIDATVSSRATGANVENVVQSQTLFSGSVGVTGNAPTLVQTQTTLTANELAGRQIGVRDNNRTHFRTIVSNNAAGAVTVSPAFPFTPAAGAAYWVVAAEEKNTQAEIQAALTAQGFTTARATNLDILVLLQKYHNNQTRFFTAGGATETTQANAVRMVVYDNDNTTVLKTIEFRNAANAPVTLPNATRYVLL